MVKLSRSLIRAKSTQNAARIVAQLDRSQNFHSLGRRQQRRLIRDLSRIVGYLEIDTGTLHDVDFPEFVGGLIQGVFQAVVDASIAQMEAYANLLSAASASVDQFIKDNVTDDQARDWLTETFPDVFTIESEGKRPSLTVCCDADQWRVKVVLLLLELDADRCNPKTKIFKKKLLRASCLHLECERRRVIANLISAGLKSISC